MIIPVDIEIVLNSQCPISKESLITAVGTYLEEQKIRPNSIISTFVNDNKRATFCNLVKHIIIGEVSNTDAKILDLKACQVNWFVYTLDSDGVSVHTESDQEGGEITMSTHLTLPSEDLFQLWENLFYDNNIKENLLRYTKTMIEFSNKGVNSALVNCNRVILLHGPPGTGKTSLCKSLAQKISIQLAHLYTYGVLIEINSHSLFSKYFSESGKLVTNMFTKIKEVCENENVLVCVLMDEIESLARARDQCSSGNEPSDAVRVVNAMLTQIDQIKKYPNVLILATSNLTHTIDLAFVDRADVKQYLGLPGISAIYKIYYSCLEELIRVKIIAGYIDLIDTADVIAKHNNLAHFEINEHSKILIKVCEKSIGLSGRSLRKIPFLAYALYLNGKTLPNLDEFLDAMEKAVDKEHLDRKNFGEQK